MAFLVGIRGRILDKDNFERFILYGIEQYTTIKECIEREFLLLLLSLPLFLLERSNWGLLIVDMIPSISYLISVMVLLKNKKIEGADYILHNGILSACMSLVFMLEGIWIVRYLFRGRVRICLLCVITIGYIIVILLYCCIFNKLAKKRESKGMKKTNGRIFFTLCGLLGISAARIFTRDIDNKAILEMLCVCCFFISYISLLGIFNFVKFYYIIHFEQSP
ncbi:MAG: hypothetical protein K2N95_12075 [Lachnospiraceae bacterium]|nr:hypothetical protein [Lachnospiraceae bacterium]